MCQHFDLAKCKAMIDDYNKSLADYRLGPFLYFGKPSLLPECLPFQLLVMTRVLLK